MELSSNRRVVGSPSVFGTQLGLLAGFSLFAGSVVLWISRLIYISWQLEDVFSASIGIALVAIPVFLFLLILFNYVFWGLRKGRDSPAQPARNRQRGRAPFRKKGRKAPARALSD